MPAALGAELVDRRARQAGVESQCRVGDQRRFDRADPTCGQLAGEVRDTKNTAALSNSAEPASADFD
jgi:hypothetical protein